MPASVSARPVWKTLGPTHVGRAIGIFEGELTAGSYSKIELYASDVEGIVDGQTASVMIPSGKLQIVKPFEVTADEPVSFVFDITVSKRGTTNEYNLLPVISESGVDGQDVESKRTGQIEAAPKPTGAMRQPEPKLASTSPGTTARPTRPKTASRPIGSGSKPRCRSGVFDGLRVGS